MKKYLYLYLFVVFALSGVVYARLPDRDWKRINPGAGSTTIVTPASTQHVVIRHLLWTVKNACFMYFHTGDKNALVRVTGEFYFGANGGIDTSAQSKGMGIIGPKGEAMKVWFDTDPGTDIMIDYNLVKTST